MRVGFVAGLAALVAVVMLMADGAASARKKLAAPAAPDANSTSLSPSALGMDEHDTADTKPDIKIPDSIKLGDHTLHFDAAGKTVDPAPRVGLDATDPHVLPMQKDQELPPAYFGLKLTTPMR
jgi:hypothetical protein